MDIKVLQLVYNHSNNYHNMTCLNNGNINSQTILQLDNSHNSNYHSLLDKILNSLKLLLKQQIRIQMELIMLDISNDNDMILFTLLWKVFIFFTSDMFKP